MNASLSFIQPSCFALIESFSFDWTSAVSLDSAQINKIVSVALASLVFFGFQLSAPLALAGGLSLAFTTITYLSEKLIRTQPNQKNDWFSMDNVNKENLIRGISIRLVVIPIIIGLSYALAGFVPLQKVAELILSGDLKIILLASLIGPVVEEILFRGFLQERLEDITILMDRYTCPISDGIRSTISVLAQGIIFGYFHILGNQVATTIGKVRVFFSTTIYGIWWGAIKESENSLATPIGLHAAGNTGVALGLLLFGRK